MVINIEKLAQAGLTPDEYVFLYQRTFQVPDEEKQVPLRVDKQDLVDAEWIQMVGETVRVLPKTKDFIENLHKAPTESNLTIAEEIRRIPEWAEEYVKLWPVKNKRGRLLRGTRKDTQKKLEQFIAGNSTATRHITKDLILKAAKAYLAGQTRDQYLYTRQCNFFINKQYEGSLLLTWIEQIEEEGEDAVISGYTDMTDDI